MAIELLSKSNKFIKENLNSKDPNVQEAVNLLVEAADVCLSLVKQLHALQEWSDKVEGHLEEVGDYLSNQPLMIENNIKTGIELGSKLQKTLTARKAVTARLAKDPKQMALTEIQSHYQNVKSQFKRRGYTAQFVRDMHNKYPVITDQKTIANLVAELNKANDLIPRKPE